MCGIAGYVSPAPSVDLAATVVRMTDRMARRGPDGSGLKAWRHAAFGHRRLAILDLSERGAQPMVSEDGALGLVFNGCIYNFHELREELINDGAAFRSFSDTEVILKGVEFWGLDRLVERLQGMFAFAVWDDRAERLSLVRDRLGVKPLVYFEHDKGLAFASTVSALRAAGFGGSVDPAAVLDFLEFGFVPDDSCIYQGMRKLAPASILEWTADGLETRSYWRLPRVDDKCDLSFQEATDKTEALFLDAVRQRLHSDVPMGALLSAGIDSGLVCWAAAQFKPDLTAFTVSTPQDPEDESGGARETAKALGLRHEIVEVSADYQGVLEDMASAYGEPFACASATAMIRVAAAVKPHATVLLTGDGGDDVFLGYPFFRNFYLSQQLARAVPPGLLGSWPALRSPFADLVPAARLLHFGDYVAGGLPAVLHVRDGRRQFHERDLLGSRFDGFRLEAPPSFAFPHGRNVLGEVIDYAQSKWFTGEFLTKVDGGSMYYAIEARSPFLDTNLWEFAARLPYSTRLHWYQLKAILRELARRHLGGAVAGRRKQGFSIPVERWLTGIWRESLTSMETGSVLVREGWAKDDSFAAEIRAALDRGQGTTALWRFVVLEKWLNSSGNAG